MSPRRMMMRRETLALAVLEVDAALESGDPSAEVLLAGEAWTRLRELASVQRGAELAERTAAAEDAHCDRLEIAALRAKVTELRGQLDQLAAPKSGSFVAVQAVHGTINVILGSGDSAQLDPTQAIVLMDKLAKAVEACGKIAPRFTVQDRPAFDPLPPPKKKRERKQREPVQTDLEQAAKAAAESEAAS